MGILESAVTYAVSWWLMLFMVLPHQADAPEKPGVGHVRSAPANPQLGKKMRWATLLAIIPTAALYFIVNDARAESIYHVGSKCKPLAAHSAAADVAARDGYGTGGKKVAPATLGGDNPYVPEHFEVPLIPSTGDYVKPIPGQQRALKDSFVDVGTVGVGKDGSVRLNGHAIAPQETYGADCPAE